MTDGFEALSLMEHALMIMDRMGLALPAAHLSMSIAALEESVGFASEGVAAH